MVMVEMRCRMMNAKLSHMILLTSCLLNLTHKVKHKTPHRKKKWQTAGKKRSAAVFT